MSRRQKTAKQTNNNHPIAKKNTSKNKTGGSSLNISQLAYGLIGFFAVWLLSGYLNKTIGVDYDYKAVFFVLRVLFSLIAFLVLAFKSNRQSRVLLKYSFLVQILALIVASVVTKLTLNSQFYQVFSFFNDLQIALTVPTVGLGILLIIFFGNEFNQQINLEFTKPQKTDKANFFKKSIKREGATYLFALLLIFIIGFFTFTHNLTHYDIFEDEFQMMSVSTGYYHTGEYKGWDLVKNEITEGNEYGVKPQIWLLAQAYKVFGLSKETARGLSVFMGLLFIFIAYFVSKYFIKNRLVALLLPLAVVFSPPYLHLFRYIRMYALVIPLSVIIIWLLHKGVTELNQIKISNRKLNQFIEKYINFNFVPLLISIPLIIINYQLHQVSLIAVPVVFVYVVYLGFFERETKYFIATAVGVIGIIAVLIFFPEYIPIRILSFFESRDWMYLDWMYSFPFSKYIVISVLAIGLPLLYVIKNRMFRNNIVYLYILTVLTFVFFTFIANYAGHDFRFVSHVVPFVILLTIYLLYLIFRTIFNKLVLYLLLALFMFDISLSYSNGFKSTYEWNNFRPWYSIAYKTIEDNIKPDEVVFGQYLKTYYAVDIYKKNKVISMLSGKRFKLDSLKKYQAQYPQGWITWATYKGWHFDTDLIEYVNSNFKKIHGDGIDSTNIEVYYYDKSMIPGTAEYARKNINVFNTNTYLKQNRAYTIAFWLKSTTRNAGIPFIYRKTKADSIACTAYSDSISGGFQIKYEKEANELRSPPIYDGNWHHVLIYKMPTKIGNSYGIIIDGNIKKEKQFTNNSTGEVLLLVSTLFKGQMQDLRIFNKTLTSNQIQAIYNNGSITQKEELWADEKPFSPVKHFTVKK